jgi:YHS domain-containing protein
MAADGAPAGMIERGRAVSWLVVHEPEIWTVAGRPVDPAEAPRYLVRVTVPGGHNTERMRAALVERVTRVLTEVDDDPRRLYEGEDERQRADGRGFHEPAAWVHIVELPDGQIGAFGRTMRLADITRMIVHGDAPGPSSAPDDPAVPTAVDPICGMTVNLTEDAITLEHDGTPYAFCNPGCRDAFAAQHRAAAP